LRCFLLAWAVDNLCVLTVQEQITKRVTDAAPSNERTFFCFLIKAWIRRRDHGGHSHNPRYKFIPKGSKGRRGEGITGQKGDYKIDEGKRKKLIFGPLQVYKHGLWIITNGTVPCF
jgi:hypothetical protein